MSDPRQDQTEANPSTLPHAQDSTRRNPLAEMSDAEIEAALGSVFQQATRRGVASAREVLRRVARQISLPDMSLVFRGDIPLVSLYEVPGSPAVSVVIEQTQTSTGRFGATGQIAFQDAGADASGEYMLSLDSLPQGNGDIGPTGTFDLGMLAAGDYLLEFLVRGQLIQIEPLKIGDA